MALKLRVISDHYKQLGKASSRIFGVHGGRIGRAPDNDWILPDPERYVSSHHAAIHFRGGKWILEDTSTNGVFVNDGNAPLSVSGPYQIKDGDRLRFGDYEFIVSIDEHSDFSPDASGQMPAPAALRRRSAAPAKRAVGQSYDQNRFGSDLGADLDINDLLAGSDAEAGGAELPGYSVEETAAPDNIPTLTATKSAPTSLLDDALAESLPAGSGPGRTSDDWHMTTRRLAKRETTAPAAPQPIVPPAQAARAERAEAERARRTSPEILNDSTDAVEAFCRGAGIDLNAIPADAQTAAFTLAGQMLREVVFTLMESLKSRAEPKDKSRPGKSSLLPASNPLKSSQGVEDALRKLLDARNTRHLGAVESLRDAFMDLKNHQLATDAATQAALDDLLFRLEPSELQERFDRSLKRNPLLGVINKNKYWELYAEFYPLLNQRDARGMPAVFTEEFARIYAEKMNELENSKKK